MATIVIKKSRTQVAKAYAEGVAIPKIVQVGWGVGGVDAQGNVLTPLDTINAVPMEFIRNNTVSFVYSTDLVNVTFNCTLVVDATNVGKSLSAVGIYDSNGDLVAVKTFTSKLLQTGTDIEVAIVALF